MWLVSSILTWIISRIVKNVHINVDRLWQFFFQLYTFETISNSESHGKTIIIIRIIIILFCARQGANICRSAYNYFKNSLLNKPLRVILTIKISVNWLSVLWNNVAESSLHKKKRIEHFSIRLFNIREYKNSRECRPVIWRFGDTQTIFGRKKFGQRFFSDSTRQPIYISAKCY